MVSKIHPGYHFTCASWTSLPTTARHDPLEFDQLALGGTHRRLLGLAQCCVRLGLGPGAEGGRLFTGAEDPLLRAPRWDLC